MSTNVDFFLNGKASITESPASVRKLFRMAGVPLDAGYSVYRDGDWYSEPDHCVYIRHGDKLETRLDKLARRESFHYSVNGEKQIATTNPLSVETILRQAGAIASVDINDLGSYFIENVVDGSKYLNLKDLVTVKDSDKFLAIHRGATPVA